MTRDAPSGDVSWASAGVGADARADVVRDRLDVLRRLAAAHGGSAVLVRSRSTFAWLTLGGLNHVVVGSELGAVALLVATDGAWALAPVNEASRVADEELALLPVAVRTVPWDDPAAADREARTLAGGEILGERELGDALVAERSRLVAVEHERLRALAADIAGALDRALGAVRRGMAEDVLAGGVGGALLERGIRAPVLLVAADDRIARYRHPLPTPTRIARRVMVVVVGERWGLHAATTRFVDLEPMAPDVARRVSATGTVLDAMTAATTPGATLDDVLRAAREAYESTGFGAEWRLHHQGGTIGYAPRERIATPGDRTRLEAGMAVAWNPSITGTKLEATLLVTGGVPERLPG